MPGRGEISWKTRTPEGARREVSARRKGQTWTFFVRERRFERWEPLTDPALEDWLQLLDGVKRRVPGRLYDPDEPTHIRRLIRRYFPEADV